MFIHHIDVSGFEMQPTSREEAIAWKRPQDSGDGSGGY
jgi:hypothetical protein